MLVCNLFLGTCDFARRLYLILAVFYMYTPRLSRDPPTLTGRDLVFAREGGC